MKDAKKFGLELEGKVADFVEEEGAAVGELEATNFLADGAGESAAFVAEEFGFEKTTGNGGAIDFDEGAIAARAEIVDGAGEEFLAGAGFAEEQDGGAGGGGKFDLGEGALERGTLANDFLKIEFTANFFFEVELFFGELVFQRFDFLEGQRVFHGDGDLRGDGLEKLDVFRGERIDPAAGEIQGAEGATVVNQRDATDGLQAFGAKGADDFRVEKVELNTSGDEGLAGGDGAAGGGSFTWNKGFWLKEVLLAGKIKGVNFE